MKKTIPAKHSEIVIYTTDDKEARLDVIISVGYRVNSKRATQFRIWATSETKAVMM